MQHDSLAWLAQVDDAVGCRPNHSSKPARVLRVPCRSVQMICDGCQSLGIEGTWGSAQLDCAGFYSEEEVSGRLCFVNVAWTYLEFGRSTCGAGGHRGWLASWPRTPGNPKP